MIEITEDEAMLLWAALARAARQLKARDEMNAEIHLAAVRLSPLTRIVEDAERLANKIRCRHGAEPAAPPATGSAEVACSDCDENSPCAPHQAEGLWPFSPKQPEPARPLTLHERAQDLYTTRTSHTGRAVKVAPSPESIAQLCRDFAREALQQIYEVDDSDQRGEERARGEKEAAMTELDLIDRKIVAELLSGSYKALQAMKLRDIADALEAAINSFESVARIVEQIHVKEK